MIRVLFMCALSVSEGFVEGLRVLVMVSMWIFYV